MDSYFGPALPTFGRSTCCNRYECPVWGRRSAAADCLVKGRNGPITIAVRGLPGGLIAVWRGAYPVQEPETNRAAFWGDRPSFETESKPS